MSKIAKSIDLLLQLISDETGISKDDLYAFPLEKISEMIADYPEDDRLISGVHALRCAMMESYVKALDTI